PRPGRPGPSSTDVSGGASGGSLLLVTNVSWTLDYNLSVLENKCIVIPSDLKTRGFGNMAYRPIVKLVDYDKLSGAQRAELNKLLQGRKAQLEKALGDVNEGLKMLKGASKKSAKTGKKRTTKRR